jgi:hypothetical protein
MITRRPLRTASQGPEVRTGKSDLPTGDRSFRSEMEHQLLEIQDAFCAFADDADRQRQDAERQKKDAEDRLRTIERQKQELEDQLRQAAGQLRKLQKTPTARIVRFFGKLNPLPSQGKRVR